MGLMTTLMMGKNILIESQCADFPGLMAGLVGCYLFGKMDGWTRQENARGGCNNI